MTFIREAVFHRLTAFATEQVKQENHRLHQRLAAVEDRVARMQKLVDFLTKLHAKELPR